jgi:histone-lysine N-methyltransferase SETD2
VLQSLLNVCTSNNIPIPELVLTNREQALMNGLNSVSPTTTHLLCTWHINKNLVSNGEKMIKNKKKEAEMIQNWNNIINITTTGNFRAGFDQFAGTYGEKFGKYMRSNRLPVAEKYMNAWTMEFTHFDHWTTSQIKSSHSFVKSHLLGPNQSLNSTIKIIINAIEAQVYKISTLHCQEKIDALMNLGALFDNCLGWITHFTLRKAQNNLRLSASVGKNDHCNGFHRLQTGIPCKHHYKKKSSNC